MPTLAAQRDAAQQLAAGLGVPHRCDVPLGPLTWYGIGGAAAVFAQPVDVPQLQRLVRAAHEQDVPLYVLGSGANLLVADAGVAGIVVKLDAPAFNEVKIDAPRVVAAAGYDLPRLITRTARGGLGGLEALAGIPASVGGAIRMNAGGAFGDIGKHVSRVRVMRKDGSIVDLHRDVLRFDYRTSHIDEPFVLEAEFELTPGDATSLLAEVARVMEYKKGTQPLRESSAGCTYKNPSPPDRYRSTDRPDTWPTDLPRAAGALIDQAGLKGTRIGGAEVSTHHANFFIAHKGCTASDLIALMEHVEAAVEKRFSVKLKREVVVWS